MRSRWNDAEAANLSGLDLLVYASRLIGAESSLVVWGGGNTSIKTREQDHRGREIDVLRVKGSGSDLKSIQRKDFPGVRMDDILALLPREDMGDQEMVSYLAHALQDPGGVRPSIETLLHGFVGAHAVVHTHADAIVSLTNNDRARETLTDVYGKEVIALDYRRPGFRISRDVADTIRAEPQARALVLAKHGTICWGATIKEAYEATIELISRAEEAIAARRRGRVVLGPPRVPVLEPAERRETALTLAPRLRGQLGRARRVVLGFDDSAPVLEFVSATETPALSQVGPATPDHTIYTKRLPCFVTTDGARERLAADVEVSVKRFVEDYTRYFEAHKFEGAELLDPLPRVVLVPGLGMFTAGKDSRTAGIVDDIYHHTIDVIGNAAAFGRYASLTAREAFDVEYWPLELYKLTLAPPERELARRVALVTGAGSGIGKAVARKLAAEGAHVVVTDLDTDGARAVAAEVVKAVGAGRATAIGMDVTSEASVRAAFEDAVLAYGGIDILVSNAGIAHGASVAEMRLEDWERSFAVNARGHFLVAREAMRLLIAQGLGGALVFVATKNVMSPGKDFSAYSASKAAEAQLAKVLALEGAPHGIRSNIVNPDAVFQDSKLWSEDIRRERAAAQGICLDQLEDFYRKRNLLAARILPEDVAEAVLFLASDRSAKTTGCTITVDGGVKDAFPAMTIGFGAQLKATHTPAEQWDTVRAVERAGYDSVWTGDHVSFHNPLYESLTLLSSYASITSRIKLGTGVYLLALRPPAIAAKITATLDVLSGGRLIFGVGVGGENPKEFELTGSPHKERGARVTEGIDVVRTLWRDTPASFDGRFTKFSGVSIDPKPVQKPGPPIWIGGRSDAALVRAGRQGDGWVSYVVQPSRFRQSLDKVREAAAAAKRSLEPFTAAHLTFITVGKDYESAKATWVRLLSARYAQDFGPLAQKYGVIGTPEQCAEQLSQFVEAGCGYFVMDAIADTADERTQLETIAAEIVPRFRR